MRNLDGVRGSNHESGGIFPGGGFLSDLVNLMERERMVL